jgi:hypothetical protein
MTEHVYIIPILKMIPIGKEKHPISNKVQKLVIFIGFQS